MVVATGTVDKLTLFMLPFRLDFYYHYWHYYYYFITCTIKYGILNFLQSNLGTVSLEYSLSDQPVFGEWTVQVIAQGQVEEQKFLVEEYYQTRFEVSLCQF